MHKKLGLLVVASCLCLVTWAQTCTQRLNLAEDDYEAGRLLGIPDRLQGCLDRGEFSKEEEVRARKLLTLVYIFTDDETKAEQALIDLLKAEPEHQLDPQVDPAEIFFLYEQFKVEPIFRIGVRAGVTNSIVNVIETFSVSDLNNNFNKFYNGAEPESGAPVDADGNSLASTASLGIGFFAELTAERHISKGIEVAVGLQWRSSRYNVDNYINNERLLSSVGNQQTYLRTPVQVRYNLFYDRIDKSILPYITVGGTGDFLLSAQYLDATRNGGTSFSLPDADNDLKAAELVENFNFSVFAGVGAKFRAKTHFVTVEIRYDNSRLNYINSDNRYTASPDAIQDLTFVEDDLSLDFVSFSVGYTRSIYKPQKLKEFR